MASAAEVQFDVVPLSPLIGAEIRTDKATLLSGVKARQIRDLLEQRGVLAFREIDLTDEEQIAFTKTLGTFAREEGEGGGESVYPITMDPKINPIAEYLKGAFFWHIDGTMSERPILASIMSARSLAREGGETEFCNTYEAWDQLPDEQKADLEILKVVHAMWRSQL